MASAIPPEQMASVGARLLSRIAYDTNGGCWLWEGSTSGGYGRIAIPGMGSERVSRASWMFHRGPIPDGLWVLHSCDTPPCFNPAHLFIGTPKMNSQDRNAKGRGGDICGERNVGSILTLECVREILSAPRYHGSIRHLADRYGVSIAAVKDVLYGRSWSKARLCPA